MEHFVRMNREAQGSGSAASIKHLGDLDLAGFLCTAYQPAYCTRYCPWTAPM